MTCPEVLLEHSWCGAKLLLRPNCSRLALSRDCCVPASQVQSDEQLAAVQGEADSLGDPLQH